MKPEYYEPKSQTTSVCPECGAVVHTEYLFEHTIFHEQLDEIKQQAYYPNSGH